MKKNKSKKKKRMRIEILKEVSVLRAGFTLIGCFIMFLIMLLITIGDIRFFLTAEQTMGTIIDI